MSVDVWQTLKIVEPKPRIWRDPPL